MDWIEWIRNRPFHRGQLVANRTFPARPPRYQDIELSDEVRDSLDERGIERLFAHQAAAIEAVRDGQNVVLATPTASGKSLAYAVPALERALTSDGHTLYIAPQNALIEDQEAWLYALANDVDPSLSAQQYTGRMDQPEKRAARETRPTVVLTTPDMLHYGLLPHSRRLWSWLFSNLSLVVLDEVHAYRGIFGSHVSLLLRRLGRLSDEFGASPQYVCCSATIGNPVEHVANLTSRPKHDFALIEEDASATGPQTWAFWQPPAVEETEHGRRRSQHVEALHLFVALVREGYQTLAFGQSRQLVERYAMESQRRLRDIGESDLAQRVRAYEAALTHERRTSLEQGLKDGSVRGVWSTSALELGVDIGGLDAVIIDGYPGTRIDTHQRAGRAGRGTDTSLVVLVGGEDQLDEYVLHHPDSIFTNDAEAAVVNPANDRLLPAHLRSAARESWLRSSDARYFGTSFASHVERLKEIGELEHRSIEGSDRWRYAGEGSPQHEMNLRRADEGEISLVRRDSGSTIATLSPRDAMRDAHPGAIYHHQGQAYEVIDLDLPNHRAELSPTWAEHYTRVRHDKDITIDELTEAQPINAETDARFGTLSVTTHITGFARKDGSTGRTLSEEPLSMPETTLDTEGIVIPISPHVQSMYTDDGDFLGGIHAAEHGMISLFPLEVLCDRGDIGGLSTPHHPDTGQASIFIYDGHPGGVGLTKAGFGRITSLLERTRSLIAGCDCANGCPACVQSPQCGNGNEPLHPETAVGVLDAILPGSE